MKTLKHEEVDSSDYRDCTHARRAIGHFLENVYYHQRLHSALDYRPPAEFEAVYVPAGLTPAQCNLSPI